MIRRRTGADLDALEALAREVHERDGYPPRLPRGFRAFVESRSALAAWVATDGDAVVGHICLNPSSASEVVDLASRTLGVDEAGLGVVARLLVAPAHRRTGLGLQLLQAATEEARRRGRTPVLDVATHFTAARRLYERAGWRRLGQVSVDVGDGRTFAEFVYTKG